MTPQTMLAASPQTLLSAAPLRHFVRTLDASGATQFDARGTCLYIKEAEYPVEVAFDDADFIAWDLAIGISFRNVGYTFRRFRVRNTVAASNRVEIYVGDFELDDRRLNIVENRSGGATSGIPTQFVESSHTFANTTPFELLPFDFTRAEVWLTADTFGTVWFGDSSATLAGASGTADFRRVGLDFSGFTKIRTRSSIWVRGVPGATVRAMVWKF